MERQAPVAENPIEGLVSTLRPALSPDPQQQSASASPMALPSNYSGEAVQCSGFILQVSLYIEMHSHKFNKERSKVAFLISLLTGRALLWAQASWDSHSDLINSFDDFSSHFQEVFGLSTGKYHLCVRPTHSSPTRQFFGQRLHCNFTL
ncbi:Retrotransposon Gag-like protein 8A [Anabarilius grahami]|uniref:Retrotransposon Gag-like protein 8A n=1 Tax=Anabarilius grahami TaxID=495550 RepID=A0A3N0ZAB6_ANAGA|nr:Retrotransposon Gag-like protein 8A [Anabarilius grahami]